MNPRFLLTTAVTALIMLVPPGALGTRNSGDFLVVDCLLPGQIRKLGRTATYVTPRRPIRTSATDCEIRGGEYVSHDRANYATALKIWLAGAEEGDPKAQNYVGEIYEKGLGTDPDFAKAASWYRKAADQGFAQAQLNLGYLHEQGWGVPRDAGRAAELYAQAAGLNTGDLPFAASVQVSSAASAEVSELRAQVASQQEEMQRLRQQLESGGGELAQLQQQNDASSSEIERLEAELQKHRHPSEQAAVATHSEVSRLSQLLEEREQEIARLRSDVDFLSRESELQNRENNSQLQELQSREAELRTQLEEQERENARLERELDNADLAADRRQELEGRLDTSRQAEQGLREDMARMAGEAAALRRDVERTQKRLKETLAALAEREKEVDEQRTAMQVERDRARQERAERAARNRAELEALEAELAQRQAELTGRQERIAALESKMADQEKELDRLRAEPAGPVVAAGGGPSIEIIEPPLMQVRGEGFAATYRGDVVHRDVVGRAVSSSGILSLLVNDQPTELMDNGMFNVRVPVFGEETPVSVVAVDRSGARASVNFKLMPEAAQQRAGAEDSQSRSSYLGQELQKVNFGRYYALVIGNNDYQHLTDLRTAINDAEHIAGILGKRYGFETKILKNATRYDILSALNEYRDILSEDDNLLVYYAGHGELDRINQRGHWLPVDAEQGNTANWVSNIDITDILSTMAAAHVMVVADSCYSGAMTRSSMARMAPGMSDEARVNWVKTMLASRSRTALTSGGLQPVLDAGAGDHSIFAASFASVLEDNADVIEGQEVFRQLSANVALAASRFRMEQVPEYAPIKYAGHEAGEFFFRPL